MDDGSFPILNLAAVEDLYEAYLRNPTAVPTDWRRYFETLDGNGRQGPGAGARSKPIIESIERPYELILQRIADAFRARGHLAARINPLGPPPSPPLELDPAYYGLTPADFQRPVDESKAEGGTVGQFIQRMREIYCGPVGVEFMHIDDLEMREWLRDRLEGGALTAPLKPAEQIQIYSLLARAQAFEEFLRVKYVGAKTFSLEGSESLIPLLDVVVENAGLQGVREIVLGMAHRGRLNVLVNVVGKPARDVFYEFEDRDTGEKHGDVKYHLGASGDRRTASEQQVHLSLCFNPSHLEFIDPVACGRVRAKQDNVGDRQRETGVSLLIHGDASFAAQGVVPETLNLSELDAYKIGGTLHVVVNNQVGFTTAVEEARSSTYATDVAHMLQIPIFHVNGEDPEAVSKVAQLSIDFRRQFRRDVVIDLYGYRRHGHNEGDDPSFTQPLMYKAIRDRAPVGELYLKTLLARGVITAEEGEGVKKEYHDVLEKELSAARDEKYEPAPLPGRNVWEQYYGGPESGAGEVETSAPRDRLAYILQKLAGLPANFHPHPRLKKLLERRLEMAAEKRPVDWAHAEALAFGSLAMEGVPIRLTGQDTPRGTFSQRHGVFHDVENAATYEPLQHLSEDQASVSIYNSPLSEMAVLGFEYGYSLDFPAALVLWEAQYGDFVNAAAVVIDQFLTSAEDKWRRLSGLVLLLPHGFDGQGPEHTSARLERFLALAANDNIQIVNATTPAQYFHVLRRQVLRRWRKPLVMMTPKSLLRHPLATSNISELEAGAFRRVLGDDSVSATGVKRIILCSGKIYYELLEHREQAKATDAAIVRIEQLYPFPETALREAVSLFPAETPVVWVQEEPENMGAQRFLQARFGCIRLFDRFPIAWISRPESAAPASGSHARHKVEQEQIIKAAFEQPVQTTTTRDRS